LVITFDRQSVKPFRVRGFMTSGTADASRCRLRGAAQDVLDEREPGVISEVRTQRRRRRCRSRQYL